ncbi:HPP family protein [Kitasatospora sp. NPDC096204]|uniref:CBS domain-containing protein n=1 Tax=Kitasatospora sp. NPDC096204 TaxID=3364094 RepID=UPI00381DC81C
MSEHDDFSAGAEARRATPGKAWSPEEPHRQETLLRYLGAVASATASRGAERPQPAEAAEGAPVPAETAEGVPVEPEVPQVMRVREVMDVPALSVRGDLPFLELARMLDREDIGAVPVVDAEDRVIGMVSESDLLAKAAVEAERQRPGPIGRLREHRLHEKARGENAASLMSVPAVSVRPGTTVADAARVAARSKLKRMPVTDQHGRLVGVVRRTALLRALVRDDEKIRDHLIAA